MNPAWHQGKKTYLIAVAIGAATVAHTLGYVDDGLYQTLLAFLGAGGAATLAAKVNRTTAGL